MTTRLIAFASAALLVGWADVPLPAGAGKAECDCSDVKVAGTWVGDARDRDKTRWTWTLKLEQTGCTLKGRFDWKAKGHAGSESVRGSVGCDGSLRLAGYKVKSKKGRLATTRYRGKFSLDLRTVSGKWLDGVPGTFKGRKR